MKISEQEISRLLSYTPSERSLSMDGISTDTAVVRSAPPVQAERPTSAEEVRRIAQAIKELPDVREERVQALKAQVEAGTYHVSSEDIADLIMRRALADNTAI